MIGSEVWAVAKILNNGTIIPGSEIVIEREGARGGACKREWWGFDSSVSLRSERRRGTRSGEGCVDIELLTSACVSE